MPLSVTGSNPAIDPGPASGESTFGTGVVCVSFCRLSPVFCPGHGNKFELNRVPSPLLLNRLPAGVHECNHRGANESIRGRWDVGKNFT